MQRFVILTAIFLNSAQVFAQTGNAPKGKGAFDPSFIFMMVVMFAIIYFLMLRPQQKKQKETQNMLSNIKKGDKVLYGKYSGSEVTVDGDDLLIMRESDILAVI